LVNPIQFFIPLRPLKIKVVKVLDEFIIPFSGLKQGLHVFDYEVNDKFFACFENSEISKGNLKISLELDRKSVLLLITISLNGYVTVMCDRCGDDFELPLTGNQSVVVKIGNEEGESDEDIIYLSLKDSEINLAHTIYETIMLSLPYIRKHPDGMCNEEALKKIKLFSSEDLTKNKSETIDPRWDALKQLKFKKK
jgi:uncharacterized protein